jgi:outer membrane protein
MHIRTCTIILLGTLFFAVVSMIPKNVHGQEVFRVSLDKAIELALKKSEALQIKANEIDKMHYGYKEAKSALYPQFEGEVSWAHNAQYPPAAAKTINDYSLDTGVTINQVLWAFGRISSAIRLADKYLAISRLNKDVVQQDVIYNTKLSYHNVLLAEHALMIVKESYENARKNKTLLEKRSSSGRVSKRDNIKMAADIASRVPRVNDAQASLDSAVRTFKMVIGIDTEVPVGLTENFEKQYYTLNRHALRGLLYENDPAIEALCRKIEADEEMIKAKRANFLPTISAFATWNYLGMGDSYDVRRKNLDHYCVAGLMLNVPLWTGGDTIAQLNQAKIDKENDILRLQQTTKEFVLDLENAMSEYHEYLNTLKANNKAVELAKETFKMTRDLFESGQVSLSDLNDAELHLTNEKLAHLLTMYNLNATLAKIEKYTGEKTQK